MMPTSSTNVSGTIAVHADHVDLEKFHKLVLSKNDRTTTPQYWSIKWRTGNTKFGEAYGHSHVLTLTQYFLSEFLAQKE
jgi:hypothetical protein